MAQLAPTLLTASEGRMALSPIGRVVFGALPEQLSSLRTLSPVTFIASDLLRPTIVRLGTLQRMAPQTQMRVGSALPLMGIVGDTDPMTGAPQPI
jgi:hypothetical protein